MLAEKPRISEEDYDAIAEKLRTAKKITAPLVARMLAKYSIKETEFIYPKNSVSDFIETLERGEDGLAQELIKMFARYTNVDVETIAPTNKTVETIEVLTEKITTAITRGAKTAEIYPLMLKVIIIQNKEIAKLAKADEEIRAEMRALKIRVMNEQSL